MKIEKQIRIKITLTEEEQKILFKARDVLEKIESIMLDEECDTFLCNDEYTYDISNLRETVDDLANFEEISEIYC